MEGSRDGLRSQGLCLDYERGGTPAVRRGNTEWSGSDSSGSRAAAGAGEARMMGMW